MALQVTYVILPFVHRSYPFHSHVDGFCSLFRLLLVDFKQIQNWRAPFKPQTEPEVETQLEP